MASNVIADASVRAVALSESIHKLADAVAGLLPIMQRIYEQQKALMESEAETQLRLMRIEAVLSKAYGADSTDAETIIADIQRGKH